VAGRKGTAGDEDVLDHVEDAGISELDEDATVVDEDLAEELAEELAEDEDAFDEVLDDDAFAEDDLAGDDLAGDVSADAEEDTASLEVPSPADPVDDEEADEGAALPATVTFDDDEDELVAAVAGVEDDEDDDEIDGLRQGEFVCRSCYMAKLETQLADAEAMLCRDCA
jgi:hypothetical protein